MDTHSTNREESKEQGVGNGYHGARQHPALQPQSPGYAMGGPAVRLVCLGGAHRALRPGRPPAGEACMEGPAGHSRHPVRASDVRAVSAGEAHLLVLPRATQWHALQGLCAAGGGGGGAREDAGGEASDGGTGPRYRTAGLTDGVCGSTHWALVVPCVIHAAGGGEH